MSLRKLHSLTALVIAAFAGLHIVNHLAGLAGVDTHIAFMKAARTVYRFALVELVLLACVACQVVVGLTLLARGWNRRDGFVAKLQAASGAYLAFFLLVHVAAVLSGRGLLALDTNFYFAAAGFHVAPYQFFFAPYYFLGVVALFAHLGCAVYWRIARASPETRTLILGACTATGAVASLFIVLALAGALYPVDIPAAYRATYVTHLGK